MRFVETPVFTAAIQRLLDDEQYRRLQIALMLRPEQGPIIPGSGGLRKVRWAQSSVNEGPLTEKPVTFRKISGMVCNII
jgi:hypothetical protein